ncbi:hypothetical protein [Agriterribacter sp.]|uniref:hypothetical protein n=1 Tax=Agriterribacter sp. TaxID=2821509 RepID=UPI002B6FB5E7|nr:hypothetical protein [Agriterribacter sp.]HRO47078.1 hypothetical protein [Agriterribacter sp.]HRQ18759.1 hypothetical protein [Agriterribacter sp.]
MTITFVKWHDWDAVQCTAGQYELIAGISAGPRILSVSHEGGKNLLYEDDTDFRVGEWRIYGGHRFTTAPESADSYYPDNDPCDVTINDSKLQISAKQKSNGTRLSMVISNTSGEEGFEIQHILENNGKEEWSGALWAITCVPRSAQLLASCATENIHFWPGTDPAQWQRVNNQMTVKQGGFRGKAGWHNGHPLLTAVQQQGTLVISSPGLSIPEACVDNGCNTEVFVCKDFMELETLSERIWVAPGESAVHMQRWRLQALL